jgi:hypothetical protein
MFLQINPEEFFLLKASLENYLLDKGAECLPPRIQKEETNNGAFPNKTVYDIQDFIHRISKYEFPGTFNKLKLAIRALLNSTELNLKDMEPETLEAIEFARNALHMSEEERFKNEQF